MSIDKRSVQAALREVKLYNDREDARDKWRRESERMAEAMREYKPTAEEKASQRKYDIDGLARRIFERTPWDIFRFDAREAAQFAFNAAEEFQNVVESRARARERAKGKRT